MKGELSGIGDEWKEKSMMRSILRWKAWRFDRGSFVVRTRSLEVKATLEFLTGRVRGWLCQFWVALAK